MKYDACLKHIEDSWKTLTVDFLEDQDIQIGLPNTFIAPSTKEGVFAHDQFYWDSYFIILGLVASGKVALAKGMVDNFAYLYRKFKIIPSRNRLFNLGISQPPFLSSMVHEVYNADKDEQWLKEMTAICEEELDTYWMNDKTAEKHLVYEGLSRYCDHYVTHVTAEHESGWDMTSRFNDHCLDYLPVDLNSLLYKYETDLSRDTARKEAMNKLMWNEKKGFFFDYNYKKKEQSNFYSLAGFYPLWAKLASKDQAKKCRDNLMKFEYEGGLANTQKEGLSEEYKQWDYPNGWPNQQWIVIKGLLNYGFKEDAKRLAAKWLDLNVKIFEKTGKMWEKYDVVEGDMGKAGRYTTQSGFGWTNAVFVKLVKELFDSE